MTVRGKRSAGEILSEARGTLERMIPSRACERTIAAALLVERNGSGWRLEPARDPRLPEAEHHSAEVIVLCTEGYASSPAAAARRDLGLPRAADVSGGIAAWASAGLPADRTTQECP